MRILFQYLGQDLLIRLNQFLPPFAGDIPGLQAPFKDIHRCQFIKRTGFIIPGGDEKAAQGTLHPEHLHRGVAGNSLYHLPQPPAGTCPGDLDLHTDFTPLEDQVCQFLLNFSGIS